LAQRKGAKIARNTAGLAEIFASAIENLQE